MKYDLFGTARAINIEFDMVIIIKTLIQKFVFKKFKFISVQD